MAMAKAAKETDTLLIIPNAGARRGHRRRYARRTSSASRSRIGSPALRWASSPRRRDTRRSSRSRWKYAAGDESVGGFKEGFEKGGGQGGEGTVAAVPECRVPGASDGDRRGQARRRVYAFFAGGGAVKFVKDYAAAGLNKTIPLIGAGFLTDGTLEAQGDSAAGPAHHAALWRRSRARPRTTRSGRLCRRLQDAAGRLRSSGLRRRAAAWPRTDRGQGRFRQRQLLYAAMAAAKIDSPRGKFTLSPTHDPVQDFYLRKVEKARTNPSESRRSRWPIRVVAARCSGRRAANASSRDRDVYRARMSA